MTYRDQNDYEDAMDAQRAVRKRRWYGCSDGFCGATDCPTCYPGSWDRDEEEDDPEDEEESEEIDEDDQG